jgi:hypothetical protein
VGFKPFVTAFIPENGPALLVPASAFAGSEQLAPALEDAKPEIDLLKVRQYVLGEERGCVPPCLLLHPHIHPASSVLNAGVLSHAAPAPSCQVGAIACGKNPVAASWCSSSPT